MKPWQRRLGWLVVAGLVVGMCLALAPAQEKRKADEKPRAPAAAKETPKPPVFKVEKGPFKIALSLKGVFETEQASEVFVSLEAWAGAGPLLVTKAAEHGAVVRKGDVILELDREGITQAIKDLEAERSLSELAIKLSEEELPALEMTAPVELAAADRAKQEADEDLKHYFEIDRDFAQKSAEQSLKQAKFSLDNQKEELKQLEKMYRSKDLTEETEEIILKRQRAMVEFAEFALKSAELRKDRALNVELPRRDLTVRETAVKSDLALKKLQATQPLTLMQKRLALAKLKYDRTKAEERLAKLQKDRDAMVVRAPSDAIVYHGKFARGQMSGASSVAGKLQRGGAIQAKEVVMTIIQPRSLFVRAAVEEKDLGYLRLGLAAKVIPQAMSEVKLPAKVEGVSAIPVNPGSFDARLSVQLGSYAAQLMPGMACTVKCVPYLREQALTLPANAVFSDELDEDKQYVYLVGKDGVAGKHYVTAGKKSDKIVEIAKGLSEGEEVLQEKPKGRSSGTEAAP